MTYSFGRLFKLDHRDGAHLLRTVMPIVRPKRKTWRLAARLDQGRTSQCVGFAWKGLLLATPRQQRQLDGPTIYAGAQRLDEWPGENYEGSSVRGGAEYLLEAKLVKEYRWAFSAEDALNGVGSHGPLVLGTDWKTGMSSPDHEGIMHYSGSVLGGHAYLLLGYDDRRGLALIHNSWGEGWGQNGRAWLPYADLEAALRDAGEACAAIEVERWAK